MTYRVGLAIPVCESVGDAGDVVLGTADTLENALNCRVDQSIGISAVQLKKSAAEQSG
jgi:hypothetical protein